MKNLKLKTRELKAFFAILLGVLCVSAARAQSTNIAFPTAVSTNEITGSIPARDIGDARLTSFYYTFNGNQGDIFINVSTTNFNGDIEVFAAEGLRSLSKIPIYADSSVSETGRIIYLRKPEKIILRVQGRTPDDNPARFTIKFAGSFVAVESDAGTEEPNLPEIKTRESGGIRVNSVGTIIEVKPTPSPAETETVAETDKKEVDQETPVKEEENKTEENKSVASEEKAAENKVSEDPEKTVAEETPVKKPAPRNARRRGARNARNRESPAAKTPPETAPEKIAPPSPLENVRLKVFMKTGEEIDFPMPDVFRFSMNNGILVITMKSGKIHRYPILETQRIVIE